MGLTDMSDSPEKFVTRRHFQKLAHWGRRMFPRRMTLGLLGVVSAAFVVRPAMPHWSAILGSLLLIGAGLGLRAWAAACAGTHTRDATISAPTLVTGGPYARVRNPIYLGTVILGAGMVGLIGDWRLVPFLFIVCVLLYATIIPAEESFLSGKFGPLYEEYKKAVPRLVPRIRAWDGSQKVHPLWTNARGEATIAALLVVIYAALQTVSVWRR